MSGLNKRALEIFTHIVHMYMETGDPVGSSFLYEKLGHNVSPATIRNVMSYLQEQGLLRALHVSSGRMPTEEGLRFFVNAILKQGDIAEKEKYLIQQKCRSIGRNMESVLGRATQVLSELSQCAGLVVVPKHKRTIEYMECILLPDGNALMVMVGDKGYVENRIISIPKGIPFYLLRDTVRTFNAHLSGRTLKEAVESMKQACLLQRQDARALVQELVRDGLGYLFEDDGDLGVVVTERHASSHVEGDVRVEEVQDLLSTLQRREVMRDLLDVVEQGSGIKIFIGAENKDFTREGCSLVLSGVRSAGGESVGVLGVVGPMRMDYAKVIPLVDYTSRMVGTILDECDGRS